MELQPDVDRDAQQHDRDEEGMRQPQAAKLAGLMALRIPRITASERKKPSVAVVWIQLVYAPRFPAGACSAT